MQSDSSKLKNKKILSAQVIEDFYINLGYQGDKLRQALLSDEEYQLLLKEKRERMAAQAGISEDDQKDYVLTTDDDFEILERCKKLRKLRLEEGDALIVDLIQSQLKDEWRRPLIQALDRLLGRYKKDF